MIYTIEIKDVDRFKLFVSDGNNKLGRITNISQGLPGNEPLFVKGEQIGNIVGRCPYNCRFCRPEIGKKRPPCYAIGAVMVHHDMMYENYAKNQVLHDEDPERFWTEVNDVISNTLSRVVRFNCYAELTSETDIKTLIRIAEQNPGVILYLYTCRLDIVCKEDIYVQVPDNLIILLSLGHERKDLLEKYPKYKQFVTVSKTKFVSLSEDKCKCLNSVNKTKCEKCKECFMGHERVIYEAIK